jgi:hypothetical protein
MQVLFATVLIDALHATLKDRIVALNGVGMNRPTNVLFESVVPSG